MSYLDTLIEIKNNIEASTEFEANQKIIIIGLIEKERILNQAKEDSFKYLYSDITSREEVFDFKPKLNDLYTTAQEHANCCIGIFTSFSQLTANIALQNWLFSAIKVVDCIVIHYLQEVLKEEAVKQGDAGKERSRYIQITKQGVKAQKAGRIMDNLYGERNKMEHQVKRDPNNPEKQILHPPNYTRAMRNIKKKLPEALANFDDAYKEYYN